jgi:hypothetical protein
MNQTMLIVILGFVAALLLVLCGILFALYRRKLASEATSGLNTSSLAAKRDSKNVAYIAAARVELKKIVDFYSPRFAQEITQMIPSMQRQLSERRKQANEKDFLEFYSYSISFVKIWDVRTDIDARCGSVMQAVLNIYQQKLLPATFEAVPDAADHKNRYDAGAGLQARFESEGKVALTRQLGRVYRELGELARLQERLAGYLPGLERLKNQGFNWGNFVQGAIGGVLTVAHPPYGILMLAKTWLGAKEKAKAESLFVNRATNEFADYLGRWEQLHALCLNTREEQRLFIAAQMTQVFEVTVPKILTGLDTDGFSLKQVPGAYQGLLQESRKQIEMNCAT